MRRLATILALTLAAGCGSSDTTPSGRRFAVVTNYWAGHVTVLAIDDKTGALTPAPGSPFTTGMAPSSVAIHPSGAFVYVVNSWRDSRSGEVWAYAIDRATGALTPLRGSPFTVPGNPWSVAIHTSGAFAYVTSADDVYVYAIDARTGALTPTASSPFAAGVWTVSVTIHPSGRFAYFTNDDHLQGSLSVLAIDSKTGALTPVANAPFASGQRAGAGSLAIHPSGAFAYVAKYNEMLDGGQVSAYAVDGATGALTPVGSASPPPGYHPVSLAIHPSGAFAYVVNDGPPQQPGDVSALAIDGTTGALTPLTGQPVATGTGPTAVVVHPSGAYAYVTNGVSDDVSVYAIDRATGALTPVPGSPFPAGTYASSIAITP
jgi:6-phosphogluconolactonase